MVFLFFNYTESPGLINPTNDRSPNFEQFNNFLLLRGAFDFGYLPKQSFFI